MKSKEIAAMIDHTILSAEATIEEVKQRCEEAQEYKFASVCVNPYFIDFVSKELAGSSIKTCTVIGFPLGSNTTEAKVFATRNAIKRGAQELDMVINIGAVKSNAWNIVEHDIKSVVKEASGKALVKVIIETCYLTDKEKRKVCEIAKNLGADFVKTSTGFGEYGARVEDIELMKEVVGDELGIKASGGIRNRADALKMIKAGATRIGASRGKEIINN